MKRSIYPLLTVCLLGILLGFPAVQRGYAQEQDPLNQKIGLKKTKGSVYELLKQISDQTGYLFVYDSRIVENDKSARIPKGVYTLQEAILTIAGKDIAIHIEGKHILLSHSGKKEPAPEKTLLPEEPAPQMPVEGKLIDRHTDEPIAYASVSVDSTSIGTITNQNGEFRLLLPDSVQAKPTLLFSHLGYISRRISLSVLTGQKTVVPLDQMVIPIQEVVIRFVNPLQLLHQMIEKREKNYAYAPVYFTSFYREGIEHSQRFVQLTEAVFQIYKSDFNSNRKDQVKILKMRKITNEREKDTLVAKMKSGVSSCLLLDLMKNLPDFIQPAFEANYNYQNTDMTEIDNRLVNVLSFEQKESLTEPLYRGSLYIDATNQALLKAVFEIHPKYIKEAAQMLIEKRNRNLTITPYKVSYIISYKEWNGTYYVNHIRGDLIFKIKKKHFLSFPSTLHTWFEMATCKIDTMDVNRFPRNEQLRTNTIFSDINFTYDDQFWGDFNIIRPEEQLNDLLEKVSAKIEEISY